ncbi:MAG: S53 family peptidase [Myxococcales bacterium]
MPVCALALALSLAAVPPAKTIPGETPVQLGVTLRLTHRAELDALRRGQQDPASPEYRHYLGPQEFGERFGQPTAVYQQAVRWLTAGGLRVTTAPNRSFLTATGSAKQVEALLGIQLVPVDGKPAAVHVPVGKPRLPAALAPVILDISGLDTRIRTHHHLNDTVGFQDMGPQDLRNFYGIQPLLDRGFVGQGQKLVVLSTAQPPGQGASIPAIQYFYSNVSDATAALLVREITPGTTDVDQGGSTEYELDMEMQSVASPGADSITLEISPSSTVFTVGVQDIVNNLPDTTATSVSLGLCEEAEQQNDQLSGFDEMGAMEQAVLQGLAEGQTWSAASGDNGSDDCGVGVADGGVPAASQAVDFPAVLPEEVAMGGTELLNPPWDAAGALTQYVQEDVWNDCFGSGAGCQGGAGGGGLSTIYPAPAYQQLIGLDGGRSVPDFSLIAGPPGVAVDNGVPGPIGPVEGTSVASPLSAGIFGLIASRVGCRLGDVHPALYALGAAQLDGGAAVYNWILTGNNSLDGVPGYSAGPGYNSATGWGSLNVAALADAWPSCWIADGGADAGVSTSYDGGLPYDQCAAIDCPDAGGTCLTLAEGPSTCASACDQQDAGSCAVGNICVGPQQSLFAFDGGAGSCLPGCVNTAGCALQPGTVCATCEETCIPAGDPDAGIGQACAADTSCPNGAFCQTAHRFSGGYCTEYCIPPADGNFPNCDCPSGSYCETISPFDQGYGECVSPCPQPGEPCGREGYLCQPLTDGNPGACLPPCVVIPDALGPGQNFDTCSALGPTEPACDTFSGYCGGPGPVITSGTSSGGSTGGSSSSSGSTGGSTGAVVTTSAGSTGGSSGGSSGGGSSSGGSNSGSSHSGGSTGSPGGSSGGAGTTGGPAADAGTTPPKASGCGCGSTGSPGEASLVLLGLVALATRRRRLA